MSVSAQSEHNDIRPLSDAIGPFSGFLDTKLGVKQRLECRRKSLAHEQVFANQFGIRIGVKALDTAVINQPNCHPLPRQRLRRQSRKKRLWGGATRHQQARFTALGYATPKSACYVLCSARCTILAREQAAYGPPRPSPRPSK